MIGTVRGLQTLFRSGALGTQGDAQLLDRFLAHREEAAFAALVERHGPMVRGVCLRILRDHHDAEDAFQAAFLVLARRAGAIRPREDLGAWLHGVALRTALKARATRATRRARERAVEGVPEPSAATPEPRGWLAETLDVELARLPERYRLPLILCDLEGRPQAEVAERLGRPIGTVSGRLCRARALLARRLARRGLAPSTATLVVAASREASAASCASLVRAACLGAGRLSAAGLVTARALTLSRDVQGGMTMAKIKTTAAAVLAAGMLATGLAVLAQSDDQAPEARRNEPSLKKAARKETKVVTYYVGDLIQALPRTSPTGGYHQANMFPLIDLITSTIAPDTWRKDRDGGVEEASGPSITPFFLSLSLIVRQEPEVHQQIASLLGGLRRFKDEQGASAGLIGTHEERAYDVSDLLRAVPSEAGAAGEPDARDLVATIKSTISPGRWVEQDQGSPSIAFKPAEGRILVSHTGHGHEQLEGLLAGLRRFRETPPVAPKAPQ